MFKKILIANRGVIAVRIERTLSKIGVKSVAVYTEADIDSLHVLNADEAVCIGEGSVKESYLNAELILKIAKETGADAVHPGYGFLSENADFAAACAKNGIVFIGPSPEHMKLFGLKHSAREIAQKAGVPVLSGSPLLKNIEEAKSAACKAGYPIMLKSTAGGGGIGMKICENESELVSGFEAVSRLAVSNFKDGGIFVEKYIRNARHIEVQVFGSRSGKIYIFGERDCSVQRRNQKVVEETPAPGISNEIREKMHVAAQKLASAAGYVSAGTVEFLYDCDEQKFYFLEVNTRLQVEHGVTEEVFGIDLVEMMIKEAAGELGEIKVKEPEGTSIQARIYAEDPLADFRPSSGKITKAVFPKNARVETWISGEIEVSPLYDPMLAKIIVKGKTRAEAAFNLSQALSETKIYGIASNVDYLFKLTVCDYYKNARINTGTLKNFFPKQNAIEVIDGGVQSSVQDYPGIVGYWTFGVPPCGAMDMFSLRLGNIILGNPPDAAGIELTLRGGAYKFRAPAAFCITGADMNAKLCGRPVALNETVKADTGDVLEFEETKSGMRAYLLVRGGFDLPKVLKSRSTFMLGAFGGYSGRALRAGDVIGILPSEFSDESAVRKIPASPYRFSDSWTIGVIAGPHCDGEFLKEEFLHTLANTKYKVHFNSSRTGVRLIGPAPQWARADGGEAGLHPSNVHDTAYAVGALDLTGDMPILLGPDGPSLGGFVCPAAAASAELWKLGQLKPGDKVSFKLITLEQARYLKEKQEKFLKAVKETFENSAAAHLQTDCRGERQSPTPPLAADALKREHEKIIPAYNPVEFVREIPQALVSPDYPLFVKENSDPQFTIRCAGDKYLLIEYGRMALDIVLRFKAHHLMQALEKSGLPIIEMTPGVRSLQVHFDTDKISLIDALNKVVEIERLLPEIKNIEAPSRIVKMPLSWDDPQIRLAVERYHKNVRPNAPWCPSNIEFIRRINGLESAEEVKKIIFEASYLTLGLGDVYLGAPLTVSLDPRHRLVTTKYNPARTWTPENAVGIGGAYMGVYGMEGPGGYQLFGRTVQTWNHFKTDKDYPWTLKFFDQIRFYEVSAQELLKIRRDFLRGKYELETEETSFNLGKYLQWLESIKESALEFKKKQQAAFETEKMMWKEKGLDVFSSDCENEAEITQETAPKGMSAIRASMSGVVWKINFAAGETLKKGDAAVVLESMKMELSQVSPKSGRVEKICISQGQQVSAGQLLALIK